jgi:hypothetical protein
MQKFLWKTLQRHPIFTLIGRPITAEILQDRLGKLQGDEKFLSVDYTDATNEMYSFCSSAAALAISFACGFTTDEYEFLERALVGHIIVDPSSRGRVSLPQQHGQLMGSVVSFPILCIVNAAICRYAKEQETGRPWSLDQLPLLINGDDAAIRCTTDYKDIWEKAASTCGLAPSVGKVYYSAEFLNMNSSTFDYSDEGFGTFEGSRGGLRTLHYKLVDDLNFGLLLGLKRSGLKSDITDLSEGSLGTKAQELIARCPPPLREAVLTQFIHRNLDSLKRFSIPWFIPEEFGGVGLPEVGKWRCEDKWLRVCRKIYDHPEKFKLPSRAPDHVSWKVWQNACKRFPAVALPSLISDFATVRGDNVFSETISLNSLRGRACVEQLFRARRLSDLFSEKNSDTTAAANYYRKASRVWLNALHDKSIPLPEPFSRDGFPKYASSTLNDVPSLYVVPHLDDSMQPLYTQRTCTACNPCGKTPPLERDIVSVGVPAMNLKFKIIKNVDVCSL